MRTLAALLLCAAGLHAEPPRYIPDDPPVYVSERTGSRTDAVPAPAYRWTREHAGQLSLWDGARFVGAWRELEGDFVAWPSWTAAELPCALPESVKVAGIQRPFVESSGGNRTPARTVAGSSLSNQDAGQNREPTRTPAQRAMWSGGMPINRLVCTRFG